MTLQYASEYRAAARNMLRGRWGQAVLVGLVASILGGTSDFVTTRLNNNPDGNSGFRLNLNDYSYTYNSLLESTWFHMIGAVTLALSIIFALIFLLIGGAIQTGYAKYNMKLVNGAPAGFGDLFSEFYRLGTCFVMNLIKSVLIAIGMFLFIIPGVILLYSYSMAPYILAEHPDYTATQALRESRMMMRGHKWRLFCLHFSFIGWALLAGLTCGIGVLWLTPYQEASNAIFYLELAGDYYSFGNPV